MGNSQKLAISAAMLDGTGPLGTGLCLPKACGLSLSVQKEMEGNHSAADRPENRGLPNCQQIWPGNYGGLVREQQLDWRLYGSLQLLNSQNILPGQPMASTSDRAGTRGTGLCTAGEGTDCSECGRSRGPLAVQAERGSQPVLPPELPRTNFRKKVFQRNSGREGTGRGDRRGSKISPNIPTFLDFNLEPCKYFITQFKNIKI